MSHELYSDFLLEHARTPYNRVAIDNPTHHTSIVNEGCSDTIELYLKIENTCVVDVGFMGNLCALSTASASLFTEYLKGKTLTELRLITPGVLYSLLHVTITESRTNCVLLCYAALQKILKTC